ncbi:MAG: DEAD/DEAH box helicase [Polyangiaceae bacterium]|nr:DEAD/DEAH box helicase [Polyangiaceae bacterium]
MTSLQSPPSASTSENATASAAVSPPKTDGPASLPTFDVLPLSHDLRTTLAEIGYLHPTPVQVAVFEPAKRGKDLVVQARTGTGKTAAFGLPMVDHLVKRSIDRVQVLTLTPTRELALQVSAEIERLGKRRGIKVTAIYGGAPMQKQIDAIAAGAQVICGTPGRVLDHLRRGTLDARSIRLVVLDESDEMLSMGFERELNAILEYLPAERQTLLFSATLPPDIERIARNKLKSPELITLSGDHVGALSIQHYVYFVNQEKSSALLRMIEVENPESAIVFCNTRDETERVAAVLGRQGFDADWLNGDLDQGEREKVMAATREGRLRFLVATDVAARGIDISHLTHVINFDFPQDAESYVHRTGRTGRAGRTGTAISLVMPQDIGQLYLLRLTYKIRPIEKQIPSETELKTRAETDLVAMFAEAYAKKSVHPDDLSLARRLLTHDSSEVILAGLLRDHLGARPTAREEASAARRSTRPKPPAPPPAPAPMPAAAPKAPVSAPAANFKAPVSTATPSEAPTVVMPAIAAKAAEAAVLEEAPIAAMPPAAVAPAAVAPATPEPAAPEADGIEAALEKAEAVAPAVEEVVLVSRTAETMELPLTPRPAAVAEPAAAAPESAGTEAPPGPPPPRERFGRREDRGRNRDRDGSRRQPRSDFSDGARDRAALRPLDRARPVSEPTSKNFVRHADFTTWQPPEEEGDDEPIWGDQRRPPPVVSEEAPGASNEAAPPAAGPGVELHVTVGRRDGARASDFVRTLEKAGIAKESVQRVRVRERHTFLTVRPEDEERAIAALNGVGIAGRSVAAERARERTPAAPSDAPDTSNGAGNTNGNGNGEAV